MKTCTKGIQAGRGREVHDGGVTQEPMKWDLSEGHTK